MSSHRFANANTVYNLQVKLIIDCWACAIDLQMKKGMMRTDWNYGNEMKNVKNSK